MSFIVDLDKDICGSDFKDVLIPDKNIIFKISKTNPYLEYIRSTYKIVIVKEEGDIIFFQISSFG